METHRWLERSHVVHVPAPELWSQAILMPSAVNWTHSPRTLSVTAKRNMQVGKLIVPVL